MTTQNSTHTFARQVVEAIAETLPLPPETRQQVFETIQSTVQSAETLGNEARKLAQQSVEHSTEWVGQIVAPIAENPVVTWATQLPGIHWLMVPLGQVDREKAEQDVAKLRKTYPLETSEQLAYRIVADTSLKAGGIGLLTNIIPPVALALFAVDIAAVTTLQAEMAYRIAAVYGFSLQDPARRGEVLAIFGLSVGGSGILKIGLGVIELLPGIGPVVGASSNAALIYSLGYVACQFYDAKRARTQFPDQVR